MPQWRPLVVSKRPAEICETCDLLGREEKWIMAQRNDHVIVLRKTYNNNNDYYSPFAVVIRLENWANNQVGKRDKLAL